jgi:hypothetical protein
VLQREMVEALIDIEIATNLIKESGGVTSVRVTRCCCLYVYVYASVRLKSVCVCVFETARDGSLLFV